MLQYNTKNINPLKHFISSLPITAILPKLLTTLNYTPQILLNTPTKTKKST